MMETIMGVMVVMLDVEQKLIMILQEMNLDLFVLLVIEKLLIIAMNGAEMEEDLIIQILLTHEGTYFD